MASPRGKKIIHRYPLNKVVGDESVIFDQDEFLGAMAEAAKSVVDYFKGKILYISTMKNISIDCDCDGQAKSPCMKDIGMMISDDPVAIDQAFIDFVKNSDDSGKEELLKRINEKNGEYILEYAESIGVGNRNYELINIDDIENNFISESKKVNEDILNDIIEFNKELNNYEYIIPNNGNTIMQIKAVDFKYYKLLSPTEFKKYHGGICWDYVQYEADYFVKNFKGVKFKTYFQMLDDISTHTFLLFNIGGSEWYWFESSWKPKVGIYKYSSLDEALKDICYKLKSEAKPDYDCYIAEYNTKNLSAGMSCGEYMDYFCSKVKKFTPAKKKPIEVIKGKVIEESKKENDKVNYKAIPINSKEAVPYLKRDSYLERHIKYLSENKGELLIDKDTDNIIGYIFVGDKTDKGFISTLEVAKQYRRQGFGDLLLKDSIKKYGAVDLEVYKDNTVAIKLYEKHGFTKVDYGRNKKYYYMKLKNKNKTINESKDSSTIDKDFKKKSDKHFKYIDMNSSEALKYITKDWLNGKLGEIAVCKEDDKLAGYIYVNKSGTIAPLEVYKNYRGYGVSNVLFKDAVEKMKGKKLGVYSDNQVAINLYKKFGFKETGRKKYADSDEVIMMEKQ